MTSKKFVYIKGAHFGNKGAELMYCAIKQFIAEHRPDISIVLAPCKHSSYEQRISHSTYQLLNISKGKYDLNRLSYMIPKNIRVFLNNKFGPNKFEYMADSAADLDIWKISKKNITVNASAHLCKAVEKLGTPCEHLVTKKVLFTTTLIWRAHVNG